MNLEDKYKLIKEKYKEIKEQNDILKKAIVEYKKDITQLEKNNNEQNNKINILLNENSCLLNNNDQQSNKITQLMNLLEEQKKNNSGWRNLMLLTKSSKENIHESVAFEELEIKIKENETLHKKIDDLKHEHQELEIKLEMNKKNYDEKLKEGEKSIKILTDKINNFNQNIIDIQNEKSEIKKQMDINKKKYEETIEKKKKYIHELEDISKKLKYKCYSKYKINFNQIPFFEKCDYYDYYIQNKINENIKHFQNFILNVMEKCSEYLVLCKELFIFEDDKLNNINENLEKEEKRNKIDYSKLINLKKISQNEVIYLEEIINLFINFKNIWIKNKNREGTKDILFILVDKIKKFFINVNIYLCVEDYFFPTNLTSKKFILKNVIHELRILKNLILKTINIFSFVICITPYNNKNIILEYFKKINIKKLIDKKNLDKHIYSNEANYDKINKSYLSEEENINCTFKINNTNFMKLVYEKEKNSLSKFKDLKDYVDKNNKIILFLINKFKIILEDTSYSFGFLKSYISFRICENKGFFSTLNMNKLKAITSLLDLTNSFINSIENFDIGNLKLLLVSLLSYYRFNNSILYEEERNYLEKINNAFNKKKIISYDSLENSLKDLEYYKKNNIELSRNILKKTKIIKKLKRINEQSLNEYKNTLMINKELTVNNTLLINSLSNKHEMNNKENLTNDIETYAEKILKYITINKYEKKNLNIKEKQLLEAYICSCIKINHLKIEIKKNNEFLEKFKNDFDIKENEIKKLKLQIETYKEEEANIHKKYEEQMNTLHDLIVTLEKQVSKLNSEKSVNKFLILCTICGSKNNIGNILKNRKCLKCNSIIIFFK
ncbi:conserved Plasmodium protein, unknown function [Plasmodium gallinaceum]|uniref:Protein phosphatase 1 regulatory subunit 21 N-terminal domain-containing protein n=1 Tax=Plasmodium gallinaceum TaxID=5849 RepID=A0A1J1H465_PLAGA|nr:conserved Plasmodium protein, unknown function [Plasmodium gallinaceum]CRG98138.1 conserved Plasmodium protein, unknown function [Plasmodium gallinaceum]